jgi:Heparinase II/III-like protein
MSLILSEHAIDARASVVAGPLRSLASSLASDLEPLLTRELYFPAGKALLSREGGRCPRDGALLEFDPFNPHEHRCPVCGDVYRGELHDRFWIYWYQLWLAERAIHAAALFRLGVDDRFAGLAESILDGYVERYSTYPNVDNVLGPTRLFFSTYLESIWLLQICVATDLLDATHAALVARVRDRIIEPSRGVIADYDEGASNRQVWNDAALLAAARLLGDASGAERAVFGASGVVGHLGGGLLADGTWFEGENYHLFAHRGLWYGVTMAEEAGLELPPALVDRFQRGFSAPFATALPDFTFPSRRDSQYGVSLRQWRVAEQCELGLARRDDRDLSAALHRLYADDIPRRDSGRHASSADAERNMPASSLTRADLSWRALLRALPALPRLEALGPRSALLDAQGLAVFRRNEGRTYVALDYGHSGGGHGHPDRLNLVLVDGDARWLDDFGTGSYVDPSLHWYRSTLAHNAPLVNGVSQARESGEMNAYDERGAAGWIVASGSAIAPPARLVRTIVVMPAYVLDELSWSSDSDPDADVVVDLPIHADILLHGDRPVDSAILSGSEGLEDGFRFLRDTTRELTMARETNRGRAVSASGNTLLVWAESDQNTEWWRATALGPPGMDDRSFRILRSSAAHGRHRFVFAWSSEVANVEFGDDVRVVLADGTTHIHRRVEAGWHVELHAGGARSSIDLGGRVERSADVPLVGAARDEPEALVLSRRRAFVVSMGEHHYRRSEQAWRQAGEPAGSVTLERVGDSLRLIVEVAVSELNFAVADATNPYDNEPADVNGDSVQLYLRGPNGLSGWMLVPTLDSVDVRQRAIPGWSAADPIRAVWERTESGYRVLVELDAVPDAIDVIVNEMPHGRERRRGQLVMSGARGEFVYLRGDRHDPGRLIPLQLADD